MRFSDADYVPNGPTPIALIVAGCASDARWRAIEVDRIRIDSPRAHEAERERYERVRFGLSV